MDKAMNLNSLRKDYQKSELSEANLPADPFVLFRQWFHDCVAAQVRDPNAVVLSTVSGQKPSARVVLLKELDSYGFVFFTSYESRKGLELAENSAAALVFYWPDLERQVRVEGVSNKISDKRSDEYFASRPYDSRVSASVSPQSRVVPSREYLEKLHGDFTGRNQSQEMKRPENWGGYVIVPHLIEFWQGRPNRLHDRILFSRVGDGWEKVRLAP